MFPFSLCQEVGKIDIRMEARLQKGEANDYKRKQQNGKALACTEMREIINWEPILHKEVLKTDIIMSFLFHHYSVH